MIWGFFPPFYFSKKSKIQESQVAEILRMNAYNHELTDGKKKFFEKFFSKILGGNFSGEKFLADRKKILGPKIFRKKFSKKVLKSSETCPKKFSEKIFLEDFWPAPDLVKILG